MSANRSAWRNEQIRLNTPWAQEYRRLNRERERAKYWTNPEYRAKAIRKAAANVQRRREAAKATRRTHDHSRNLDRAIASARRLAAKAHALANRGYTGNLNLEAAR